MSIRLIQGDALAVLRTLPDESVHCCVTSPPYWGLRDYGVAGQMGLEKTPQEFVQRMVEVFREVRRVLRSDGTCWVNMGDSYASGGKGGGGSFMAERGDASWQKRSAVNGWRSAPPGLKDKDLCGIPWRLAFGLQDDGWYLRQDIIWSKPNPMPESVTDRCTKAHEYLFLLSKRPRYYFDAEAIKERAVADHEAGNTSHKGKTAYDAGDERHRTKVGLVAYAERTRRNSFARESKNTLGEHGQKPQHRPEREPLDYIGTRNKRSVWEIATSPFSEAHFATFPPKLVEPCILAGTGERGCCAQCGAPLVRVVDVSYDNPGNRSTNGPRSVANREVTAGFAQRLEKHTETAGWQRSCECDAGVVPCTVLDPFSGAGTTGLVASRLGRSYIGIELNAEYLAMSERRIREDAPLLNSAVSA